MDDAVNDDEEEDVGTDDREGRRVLSLTDEE